MTADHSGPELHPSSNPTNGEHMTNGAAAVNDVNGTNGVNGINGVNGTNGVNGVNGTNGVNGVKESSTGYRQDPIAVVGLACRLPDSCNTPSALWKFLESGGIAKNRPPSSRFDIDTHYDGSLKNKTMASPGGMFLQDIDPADIDAQFFKLSRIEAVSMDPQQRQLLEVVYEGLENAGVTLESIDGKSIGCFVASFACDYGDMQARDPEDRAPATVVGIGRAMLSNRISHFLNIHGPSMTIDTACSGSLTGLDVACRYLHNREMKGAIVAGCNMYLSPEHVMDHHMGANGTASLSGKCHTFDEKADGYIKAEAVNMVYLKRLDDAIRDGDPIRAVIRGTATNSDGWTAGIASPNSEAQARAIRQAYANAGISDLSATSYVECHGTGTRAGDVIEVKGVASVFGSTRTPEKPLRIGSVKANIGHSEPGAGISGLLKTILSLEKGVIPGNPTFITPNPNLDFPTLKVLPSRTATAWPVVPFRRASVNSFGYGGSNAHVVVDAADGVANHVSSYRSGSADLFDDDDEVAGKPYILAFSANDDQSLRGGYAALDRHLWDPSVKIELRDLAYTLSEKRTRHYHRGYTIANNASLDPQSFTVGTIRPDQPKIGFVFTGQGAQWSEMGKDLVETFPVAADQVRYLDEVLQTIPNPPTWTLFDMLTKSQNPADLKRPEFSQPICTALQLAMLAVINAAGVKCEAVAGHSSGEIAAAVAAGLLTASQAIKIAYYRGQATSTAVYEYPVGMLAAGLGAEQVKPYLEGSVQIACFNSPASVTLSGKRSDLENLESKIKNDGHFARLLQVDAAYHSKYMSPVAGVYQDFLDSLVEWPTTNKKLATMFSTTTGKLVESSPGSDYWVQNMTSPVMFNQSLSSMLSQVDPVNVLIEIGPSNALSGPVNQIKAALSKTVDYIPAWKRGAEALHTFFDLAGKLFIMGASINLAAVNKDMQQQSPSFIVDLPNYAWNHSTKYWYENEASVDWRLRKFVHHDLLGGKILGAPWSSPVWKKVLKLSDLPWLRDHKLSESVIFPASGYVAMAIEGIFQKTKAIGRLADDTEIHQVTYKLRDVSFSRAMPLEDQDRDTKILLSLTPCSSTKESWHEFIVSSIVKDAIVDHCNGRICIVPEAKKVGTDADMKPFSHGTPAALWYKAMKDVGYSFGPSFQRLVSIEATAGQRQNRAKVSFAVPESKTRQSEYALHPACIDSCFQAGAPSLWSGHRSAVGNLMLPVMIDELTILAQSERPEIGIAIANADFMGIGRMDDPQRYKPNVSVYNEKNHELLFRLAGLRFQAVASNNKGQSHIYTRVTWKQDISFISNERLAKVLAPEPASDKVSISATVAKLIDLVAHKNPSLRIMESSFVGSSSVWIDQVRPLTSAIATECEYAFSVPSDDAGLEARTKYVSSANVNIDVHDPDKPFADVDSQDGYDILIVRVPRHYSSSIKNQLEDARGLLSNGGFIVILQETLTPNGSLTNGHTNGDTVAVADSLPHGFEKIAVAEGAESDAAGLQIAYLGAAVPTYVKDVSSLKEVHLVRFQPANETKQVEESLCTAHGWQIVEHSLPLDNLAAGSTVVVLDEMFSPVISKLSDEQYLALQQLVEKKCRLLWITAGAHMDVKQPEQSLFVGLARSLLSEDPGALIMSLDVESSSSSASIKAVDAALERLVSADTLEFSDSEFVERDGLFYINRVVQDELVNQHEKELVDGPEQQVQSLHSHTSCVRWRTDRPGTLDSLHWAETNAHDILEDDKVEVEVHSAALNFKDLANVMGFVAANEHQTGLEAAGIVTRVGKAIDNFKIGDRVVVIRRDGGCFANKVKHIVEGVHHIPDWMSFEDAATMGICYATGLYSLVDLANVQKGQTVLIHSASGGVGLAAIQLCRYLGAEIYVTVGSELKRQFLRDTCDIPEDRMFSSRSVTFAPDFMKATNGKGADVILNSLSGDMLHESWQCIAENGQFIEIGKKDMLDRNNLSMEPFSWNASYRAFDLSLKCITDATAYRLLAETMRLASERHITPLHICKTFTFDNIVEAFRYMRDGKHLGKIVITDVNRDSTMVPIKPIIKPFQLKQDVSYLIAGGLKGLCGSLAIYMARHGAKNLVILSRSGHDDPASQSVLHHLEALGSHVDLVRGDVTSIDDVRRTFSSASKPVAGVIQGAMVLRDKLFPSMTADEFRDPIAPKVPGTWNLHYAAQEQATPLEFFTMLSSVSGIVGQSAQTNYAAGNVFQDCFANYRHSLGLSACAVNLGLIEDVGYFTERQHFSRRLESKGWPPINEALLHKILRLSILQQTATINPESSSQLVTGIPCPLLSSSPLQPYHRFSALRPSAGASAMAEAGDSHLAVLKKASKGRSDVDQATLLAFAVEVVNAVLMRSLGLAEPLEVSRPLASYGIDSLVAVELRNWVRSELGVEISGLDVTGSKTLVALCEVILKKL